MDFCFFFAIFKHLSNTFVDLKLQINSYKIKMKSDTENSNVKNKQYLPFFYTFDDNYEN